MKIVATICVRMGSSRLYGKVLRKILGKPLLFYLVERVKLSKNIDEIVIATSINKENDVIEEFCNEHRLLCYRGPEDDVLGRILQALEWRKADVGVEIFGDCPLIDPKIIDLIIEDFINSYDTIDFLSNDLKTTFPPGMEVEVFKLAALKDADSRTNDLSIREHGTLFIRQNPQLYRIKNIEAPVKYRFPDIELEVDTEEDFTVISEIFKYFNGRLDFTLDDILNFIKSRPDLVSMNNQIARKWRKFRND
ncbi:MAG: glycosyltransferase family protein [Candidatus Pacearchaeota archaeon]